MALEKHYRHAEQEPALDAFWQEQGIYQFSENSDRPLFIIDTPPPTVSGKLHVGHVYSYSHADFIARYHRMRGENVFYPMGFDDNGLPTERLVEKRLGKRASEMNRAEFIEHCLRVSEKEEEEYRALWRRLGLSIDWRYTYRTIGNHARRCAQSSFIDLYNKGLAYRAESPSIWCPECGASFAQADLEDRIRQSEFVNLPFVLEDGEVLSIATTRPELLAACVAIFVHPGDRRYSHLTGSSARVPLYDRLVPILTDHKADPEKGTGAVMCCTFGDSTDVEWQRTHDLPVLEVIDPRGRMTERAGGALTGALVGLPVAQARKQIKDILDQAGLLLSRQPVEQSVRVHERCDTPVEYRVVRQWFVRVVDNKETFLRLGETLRWHPEQMHARYRAWVENLNWDWCISRQRYYGVPFPVWYCESCGQPALAEASQLPVDPSSAQPVHPCSCGGTAFRPDTDVMDTWATSSLSPQIISGWLEDPRRFESLFPSTMRPQAHEIIRTWAFYTIVKSWYHFGSLPWSDIFISGWAVAGEGQGKISKSKGGGPQAPMTMIERLSADALRYWAASTSPGKDAIISEEKIAQGTRLITKLWNVARFAEPFITGLNDTVTDAVWTPADRWINASAAALVKRVTTLLDKYEYASAKAEIEQFFWHDLADNYIEMAKQRLYDPQHPGSIPARLALRRALKTTLVLLAPFLPYVTEAIWSALFAAEEGIASIHSAPWLEPAPYSTQDIECGEDFVAVATAARRYKSERALSLGSPLGQMILYTDDSEQAALLQAGAADLSSVTRAQEIVIRPGSEAVGETISIEGLRIAIEPEL